MPEPCRCLLANSRPARSWSNHPPSPAGGLLLTARVSSAERRADGERQARRVAQEAGKGITLGATVTEVGSGVNGNRATLGKVLADPQVSGIVVEHRDRLARFG